MRARSKKGNDLPMPLLIKEEKNTDDENDEEGKSEDVVHAYQCHLTWNHMWGPSAGTWPNRDFWRYIDLYTCLGAIMLEYYNSPKFKQNFRRDDQNRVLPDYQIRTKCFICVVCYKHTGGQSPFFCTFLNSEGLIKHYSSFHNNEDLYGQTRKSNMRQLTFPENPTNAMKPEVKLVLSGDFYYLSTTRQNFDQAIGQRALHDIRGDLIMF